MPINIFLISFVFAGTSKALFFSPVSAYGDELKLTQLPSDQGDGSIAPESYHDVYFVVVHFKSYGILLITVFAILILACLVFRSLPKKSN